MSVKSILPYLQDRSGSFSRLIHGSETDCNVASCFSHSAGSGSGHGADYDHVSASPSSTRRHEEDVSSRWVHVSLNYDVHN